jgi:hypothetical protein
MRRSVWDILNSRSQAWGYLLLSVNTGEMVTEIESGLFVGRLCNPHTHTRHDSRETADVPPKIIKGGLGLIGIFGQYIQSKGAAIVGGTP